MPHTPAPTVRRLGWLHFWNDFTLDFITPLLPTGVPVAWLGLMEGAADGVAQVLKLFTGRASDRSGKRAAWVATGYAGNAFFRPLAGVGVLLAWPAWIVVCRIGDRLGKGLRGSATDALTADWTPEEARATTYARMRTMDHLGATIGALAAAGAVALWQGQAQIGWMICALAVPAVAMLWLTRGLSDVEVVTPKNAAPAGWWPADKPTRQAVAVVSLAGLGAKVGPLLILAHVADIADPATRWPLWQICLGWAALALVQAVASSVAGWGADKLGATGFLRFGWLVGAAVFAALAFASGPWLIVAGLAWGLLAGFTEGAEKTVIAAAAPKTERATAFGAMGLLTAITGLVGSAAVGFGLAWYGGLIFALPAVALVLSALVLARPQSAAQPQS